MARGWGGNKPENQAYGTSSPVKVTGGRDGTVTDPIPSIPISDLGFSRYPVGMQGQPAEGGIEGQMAETNQRKNGTYESFVIYDQITEGITGEDAPLSGSMGGPSGPAPQPYRTKGGGQS